MKVTLGRKLKVHQRSAMLSEMLSKLLEALSFPNARNFQAISFPLTLLSSMNVFSAEF